MKDLWLEEGVIALGPTVPPARGRQLRWRTAAMVVLLVALAVLSYLLAGGPGGSHRSSRGAAAQFYVVGSDIVGPDHKIFRPVGANLGVTGSFDWRGPTAGHSADAIAWGWNTVRLNVTCSNRASYSVRYKDGYQALLRTVYKVVDEYTAKKIVVIIACHDPYSTIYAGAHKDELRLTAGGPGVTAANSSDVGKTYQEQMDGFWTDVADRYRTNPYVWFNFWNEPFGNDNAAFLTLNQHFYDLVRSRGSENVVLVDLMNSGNDAAANGAKHIYDASMGPAFDAGKCNVVFSLHAYGWGNNAASYQRLFAAMKQEKLALMVGEFGYKLGAPATDPSRRAADAMFAEAPSNGIGLLAWNGTFGDGFSLKASGHAFYDDGGDGTGLSPLGQQLWSLGHAAPTAKPFGGALRDSGCPSAAKN